VIKIVRLDTIMHAMWDAIISAARFQEDSERWRERERERERERGAFQSQETVLPES